MAPVCLALDLGHLLNVQAGPRVRTNFRFLLSSSQQRGRHWLWIIHPICWGIIRIGEKWSLPKVDRSSLKKKLRHLFKEKGQFFFLIKWSKIAVGSLADHRSKAGESSFLASLSKCLCKKEGPRAWLCVSLAQKPAGWRLSLTYLSLPTCLS